MQEYKGYWIALVEVAPLRWLSTVQRLDGSKIKDLATSKTFTIWECPRAAASAEAAIAIAKAVIDGCRLDVERDGNHP
jgi:hypothetical protein